MGISKNLNPTKEQFEKWYWRDNLSISKIAKELSISQTAVSYWMKKYGVPRRTVSESLKGRQFSEEHRRRISETRKRLFSTGRLKPWTTYHDEQYINRIYRRIGRMKRGTKHSPEVKAKIRAKAIGRRPSEKTRYKMSEAHRGKKLPPLSEEQKRKLSLSRVKLYQENPKLHEKVKEQLRSEEMQRKRLKALFRKPTKSEKKLDLILQRHFPGEWEYTGDGSHIIYGLSPDWTNCNGKKKLIELFGEAFHDPDKAFINVPWKATEFGRKAIFSQLRYSTLIIWDYELGDERGIIERVENFLEK